MNHSFNIKVAKIIGVECAVLIENIAFWLLKNIANEKHFHDGYCWTYNSEKAFSELFPYWSRRQIQRIINNLVDKKIIKTGSYNKLSFDRTKWYTIIDNEILRIYNINYKNVQCIDPNGAIEINRDSKTKKLYNVDNSTIDPNSSMECTKPFNALTQSGHTIPDINSNINTDIKNSLSEQNSDEKSKSSKVKNIKTYSEESKEYILSLYLLNKIKENKPNFKNPNLQQWATHMDYIIRIDKRKEQDIKKVIDFVVNDPFWKSNILSTSKLREKFDALELRMENNNTFKKEKINDPYYRMI